VEIKMSSSIRKFRKKQKQASENLSRILNPNNKYKRQQKALLKAIFGN